MNGKSKLYVVDIGMITPVGANAEMTVAAIKAGISSYKESDYFDDNYNKIKLSCVPQELLEECLVEDVIVGKLPPRHARMLQLAKLALDQVIESIPNDNKIPLFLAGSESTSANDPQITNVFLQNMVKQSDIEIDLLNSRIITTGRAGGLDAIDIAMRFLEASSENYALVGAVDTFHEKNIIEHYLQSDRLCTSNTMDGFIPGEGAAFILLSKKHPKNNEDTRPYILEPGIDQEHGHIFSDQAYTGSGLASAVSKASSISGSSKIGAIYSSMNGEHYFSKELGVALMRNSAIFSEDLQLLHPADCYGDLGSAAGIAMIGMACIKLKNDPSETSYLVYASSDCSARGAAIVSI